MTGCKSFVMKKKCMTFQKNVKINKAMITSLLKENVIKC